jgi:hypothetical protein
MISMKFYTESIIVRRVIDKGEYLWTAKCNLKTEINNEYSILATLYTIENKSITSTIDNMLKIIEDNDINMSKQFCLCLSEFGIGINDIQKVKNEANKRGWIYLNIRQREEKVV